MFTNNATIVATSRFSACIPDRVLPNGRPFVSPPLWPTRLTGVNHAGTA
jgi:hypothetical protein